MPVIVVEKDKIPPPGKKNRGQPSFVPELLALKINDHFVLPDKVTIESAMSTAVRWIRSNLEENKNFKVTSRTIGGGNRRFWRIK